MEEKEKDKLSEAEETVSPDTQKAKKDHKKLRHGTMATVTTIIFVAAVVLVNIIAGIIFKKYPLSLDLTKNSKYSISEESEKYVKDISADVTIKVFAKEENFTAVNDYTKQANEVIKRYCEYNSHIKAEYIDIDSNPDIVSEYSDYTIGNYSIIVESPSLDDNGNQMYDDNDKPLKKIRQVSLLDLITLTDEFEQQTQGYGMSGSDYLTQYAGGDETTAFMLAVQNNVVQASTADQAFVSALMAVTDPNPMTVCVLTGRSELAPLSYLKKLLQANGYTVTEINITTDDIPSNADMCIIPAPQNDYMESEIKKVDDFVANDGKMGKQLIYIANYAQQETPNIDEFLEEYYIKFDKGVAFETDQSHFTMSGSGQIYTIADNISGTFADGIDTKKSQLLLAYPRPIKIISEESGKQKVEALVTSTDQGCIMDTETGKALENGKQTFAALSSKASFEDGGAVYSNILVLGSSEMVSDQFLMFNQFQNRTYILSLINGMTGKTSTGMTIEPKVISANIFDITAEQIRTLKIIFIGVIPAVTLITGLVIWLRRKNR